MSDRSTNKVKIAEGAEAQFAGISCTVDGVGGKSVSQGISVGVCSLREGAHDGRVCEWGNK